MRLSELNGLLLPFLKKNANAIRNKGGAVGEFPAYQQPEKIAAISGGGTVLYLHVISAFQFGEHEPYMMPAPTEFGGHGALFVISTRSASYAGHIEQFASDMEDGTIKAISLKRILFGYTRDDFGTMVFESSKFPYVTYEDGRPKICLHPAYNSNYTGTDIAVQFGFTSTTDYYTGYSVGTITTDSVSII